jgi:hypothetical protein
MDMIFSVAKGIALATGGTLDRAGAGIPMRRAQLFICAISKLVGLRLDLQHLCCLTARARVALTALDA